MCIVVCEKTMHGIFRFPGFGKPVLRGRLLPAYNPIALRRTDSLRENTHHAYKSFIGYFQTKRLRHIFDAVKKDEYLLNKKNKPPFEKNTIVDIVIDGLSANGEGVGRAEGFALFVPGALPGEKVRVKVVKMKQGYGYGKLDSITAPSDTRRPAFCPLFGRCGGCDLQHMAYEAQLLYKQQKIQGHLERIGGFTDIHVPPVIGMEEPLYYRNKSQFPVALANGKAVLGFYRKRSHDIIPVSACANQHPVTTRLLEILSCFLNQYGVVPYDEAAHTGLVRHVLIRTAFATGQIMVCLVINGHKLPHVERLIEALNQVKGMTSVCINKNTRKNNVIMGTKTEIIWGKPTITEFLGPLRFQISAESFFQVNPIQTEVLYTQCVALADLQPTDVVLDVYCGIGGIALFMARHVRQVIGVEISPRAVADAKENAKINGAQNTVFIAGDAAEILPALFEKDDAEAPVATDVPAPNIVVLDPPRAGCDERLLTALCQARSEKVVYVSCNSATLARDLKILCASGYKLEAVQGIDCFPMTTHVECIAVLKYSKRLYQ